MKQLKSLISFVVAGALVGIAGACVGDPNAMSATQWLVSTVALAERFDGSLSPGTQSLCATRKSSQVCSLEQATRSAYGPPLSAPYFGRPLIVDRSGYCTGPVEVRYKREFTTSAAGTYHLSAYVGVSPCDICNERARLFIDGALLIERIGPATARGGVLPPDSLEQAMVTLAAGAHTIEIGMYSNEACYGGFSAYFDNIALERPDSDGDGVPDGDDLCPGTASSDPAAGVPSDHLLVNRWADLDGDGTFDTVSPQGQGPGATFSIGDTRGCNCAQIIGALGLGEGHSKFGCSLGAMRDWVELSSH